MEEATGLQRLTLRTLNNKIINSVIVGIIIRSTEVRVFVSTKDNNEKAVWNFTIRDSITDYINVTCWGSSGYINHLYSKFIVGDVVDIMRPKINIRHIEDKGESYRPSVTSPFNLTLNEEHSSIIIHDGDNYHQFLPLLQYPTKPAASYLTLGDIVNNGGTIRGEHVDLLVAVQFVGALKKLKAKTDGREILKRDITVLDQTHVGMKITFWEQEFIHRATEWKPRETILFIADVKVDWSNFDRSMVAVPSSKTIITEDPLIPQAESLRVYASKVPLNNTSIIEQLTASITELSTINNVMTTARVIALAMPSLEKNAMKLFNSSAPQFTALLYAFVTELDLDGYTPLVIKRCERCFQKVTDPKGICVNLDCPVGSGSETGTPTVSFNMRVCISDHTGTLICRMVGPAAERVLGCTVDAFLRMSDDEKADLKWAFLLERCKVRIVVMKRDNAYPLISILSCENDLNPEEVAARLPVY